MITINDRWYIRADEYQYILCRKDYNKKKDETYETTHGFYGTLSAALEALIRRFHREVVSEGTYDLKAAIKAYIEIKDQILSSTEGV